MFVSDNQHKRFNEYLLKSKKIVIIPHKEPDGDAMGAALAWYNVLITKEFIVEVVSPSELPTGFNWMQGFDKVTVFNEHSEACNSIFKNCDLFMFLDFNSISRVGKLSEIFKNNETPRIVIDHHPYPDASIGDLLFSETVVSSTCELSYAIMSELGLEVNKEAAECLYAGIMTDTGILSYNSSRPETYHVVADLISKGIDKDKIHREVFHSNSLERMLLLGHALCNKLEVLPNVPVALISLSMEELKQFNYKSGDTEGLVNYPLSIDGIEISALFTQREDNLVKISFRSRGNIAVNKFSETYFNGGGHHNAAGGEMRDSLENSLALFKKAIVAYMAEVGIKQKR
jgi:phosphoesterase RecJ-like protein